MFHYHQKLMILVVLACLALSYDGNAQIADSSSRSLDHPNALEANLSIQTFFDGYGMMQLDHREYAFKAWASPRFGLTYERRLTKQDAVSASVSHLHTHYFADSTRAYEPGDFSDRKFYLIEINYQRYIIFNDRIKIKAKGGVAYRHGLERYHLLYSAFESKSDYYKLRDVGATVGLEVDVRLIWQFYWTGKCSYTRFLYTYDKPRQVYPVRDGPTKNMLSIQTGLGCRF